MEIFWNEASRAEWENMADSALAPLQQRWAYGAAHAALEGQVQRAVITQSGQPVALCQCLGKRIGGVLNVSLASRGPLWLAPRADNSTQNFKQAPALALICRTLPLAHPRVRLFTLSAPLSSARLLPLMTPATFALRPLPVNAEDLHGKWRNALRKAEKYGLNIRHQTCSLNRLEDMLAADAAQQKACFYRALPAVFTRMWQSLEPKRLRLFSARERGKTIASSLFLQHGNTATYHIAHSTVRGRQTSAARLLLWRAFQDFTTQGVRQIDLGMIDTEASPGLARFKLGSGAKAYHAGPTALAI